MKRNSRVRPRTLSLAVAALSAASSMSAQAFDVPVHIRITNGELRPLRADIAGQPKGFSPKALEQIAEANEAVDSIMTGSAAYWHSERHFTDENYTAASRRLISLRAEVISLVSGSKRDGQKARERLGQALHTLQDFYSHSNWVERGNSGISTALGKNTLTNPSRANRTCPDNPSTLGPNGGGSTTSGYFVGFSLLPSNFGCSVEELPPGKCFHGNYTRKCMGINKDLDAAGARHHDVPQNPHHGAAASLGRQATRTFVQGILDDLKGNDRALMALLDVRGTLGFVVDDTGSMGSSIAGVVGTINQMVGEVSANPDLAPDNYLFVRFGDPSVGAAMITEDAGVLRSAVASLSPRGGGDCPELSQAGLLTALNAALPDSHLYLFTDATAKDSGAVNQVIAQAQAKGTQISYGLTGSCSPIDPAYIRGAAETGGQLFRVHPSEIPALYEIMRPQLQGDLAPVMRRRVDLGSSGVETMKVPVDSTVRGLLMALTVVENDIDASHRVRIHRPSGEQVASTDPGVKFVTLSSGVIIRVDAPEPGEWTVEVDGHGPFTATVHANTSIDLRRFDFVEPNGDIHGGFNRTSGQPVAGAPGLGEAALLGPFSTAHFSLVDESGKTLKPLPMTNEFMGAHPEHFLGETELPAVPFRIAVAGVDVAGLAYRREYPAVYRAQPIRVQMSGLPFLTLTPGTPARARFTVTNVGATATFRTAASDTQRYVTSVIPASLTLEPGEKAEVTVTLEAPAGTIDGSTSDLTVSVTDTAAPAVFNSTTVLATVVANRAPVCELADEPRVIWPPNGKFVELALADLATVTDSDGDALTLAVSDITQDEPVRGPGADTSGPDADGVDSPLARVRAERLGGGNGRVYSIGYTATDGRGGSCAGRVQATVPHDNRGAAAVDDGQQFDSTVE